MSPVVGCDVKVAPDSGCMSLFFDEVPLFMAGLAAGAGAAAAESIEDSNAFLSLLGSLFFLLITRFNSSFILGAFVNKCHQWGILGRHVKRHVQTSLLPFPSPCFSPTCSFAPRSKQ
jgi:hypothetical protein